METTANINSERKIHQSETLGLLKHHLIINYAMVLYQWIFSKYLFCPKESGKFTGGCRNGFTNLQMVEE